MAQIRMNRRSLAAAVTVWMVFLGLIMMEKLSNAERLLKDKDPQVFADEKEMRPGFLCRVAHFLWQSGESSYEPVWPVSFLILLTIFCSFYVTAIFLPVYRSFISNIQFID